MTFQSVSMAETQLNRTTDECMICHCGPEDDIELDSEDQETLNSVKVIKSLVKECTCVYYVHEPCLKEWLTNAPMCPICKTCMYYGASKNVRRRTTTRTTTRVATSETRPTSDNQTNSVTRCLCKFLCCMSSPGAVRNAPT